MIEHNSCLAHMFLLLSCLYWYLYLGPVLDKCFVVWVNTLSQLSSGIAQVVGKDKNAYDLWHGLQVYASRHELATPRAFKV